MAKKSKLAKYRSRRKARGNPEKELAFNIGAGFAGYSATRLLSRIAFAQTVKRWPDGASYAHVIASAAGAAGVYFGSKYWSKVDDYHEAASIGAGIALLQTAIQTYMPKIGWIVADVNEEQYAVKKKKELPPADLNSLLPTDDELAALPEGTSDFDLDALLAENPEVEAVPLGESVAESQWDNTEDYSSEMMH